MRMVTGHIKSPCVTPYFAFIARMNAARRHEKEIKKERKEKFERKKKEKQKFKKEIKRLMNDRKKN